jgi:hypothetical protein
MGILQGLRIERTLWLRWVPATTVGSGVGWLPALLILSWYMHGRWSGIVGGAVMGASIGTTQWLVLRKLNHQVHWWVLANALIWSLSMELINVVSWQCTLARSGNINCDVLAWTVGGLVSGTLIGIVQWLSLRRWTNRSGWWIFACAVGWGLGCGVGMVTNALLFGSVAGTIAGAVTGGTLWQLQRRLVSEPKFGPK